MLLIKLDAIGSTNDFLKDLSRQEQPENFTVVTAENQTQGKGQMGSVWNSETGKNLIMSVLIKDFIADSNAVYNLNIAVSLAVIRALEAFNIPKLSIKWPNDILSDDKKIGGILIENSFRSDGSILSVAGLGLNVNQTSFEDLPRASSLAVICNTDFDKEEILSLILENLQKNIQNWDEQSTALWSEYTSRLFKKDIPMAFQNLDGNRFTGIIQGVSSQGKLEILMENDVLDQFDIKEIQMLY